MQQRHLFAVTLIILVASALRLWDLTSLPYGLHYDEAANVIITRQIASGESLPIFISAYTGKEVLYFYWAALWSGILGGAAWSLRLASATAGLLTVCATYAAARALTHGWRNSSWVALFAAAWIAVSFPHVLLSHYSFRAITQPLLEMLAIAALWRGWRTNKTIWLMVGGICLGLAGYTYLAARLFPIPVALALVALVLAAPHTSRNMRIRQVALVLAFALVVFAPLGVYFITHPGTFDTRISQVASSSPSDALRGIWQCIRGLFIPGMGDPYIRFNLPGRPMLDLVFAVLAIIGLVGVVTQKLRSDSQRSGRVIMLAGPAIMLLPSALATSEITPSNLRMVGLIPFLALLVGIGTVTLLERLPAATFRWGIALALFLVPSAVVTYSAYHQWATSSALFIANDGEMTLAARALDQADRSNTTVYIESLHYQHPTVAALAKTFPAAKWLTGGATLVLPAQGDALYLVPASLPPPAPWPVEISQLFTTDVLRAPDGSAALYQYRLAASDIARLRPKTEIADFAHVVLVHDAHPLSPCQVARMCPVLVIWQVRAPYPSLQAVVRLMHPVSGQWDRVNPFHYPTAEWTIGDVVLDQFTPTPPVGTPPIGGYQVGVSFFNPDTKDILPRLKNEQFAGLEVTSTLGSLLHAIPDLAPTSGATPDSCAALPVQEYTLASGLLVRASAPPATARPGERVDLTLCWKAPSVSTLPNQPMTLSLNGANFNNLYQGAPVQGAYPFSQWGSGEQVVDRFSVHLPRQIAPGLYSMTLSVGASPAANLGQLVVPAMARTYTAPMPGHIVQAQFGEQVQLVGYDADKAISEEPFKVVLYWKTTREMDANYTVYLHLVEHGSGSVVAQIDEQPRNQTYPTSLWAAGEYVSDEHTLHLPALAPGQYDLNVGLYIQDTGERLLVNGAPEMILGSVQVNP